LANRSIRKCRECPLHHDREVPYDGKVKAEVAWVGESPGREELGYRDAKFPKGKPFVGKAGKVLKKKCTQLGIDLKKSAFLNSARCLINKKQLSNSEIKLVLSCCRPMLVEALKRINPRVIVCLGGIALEQVLKLKGVEKRKGEFFHSDEFGCDVFVLNHPAATLHDPSKLPIWSKHMEVMAAYIANDYKISEAAMGNYKAVGSVNFLLNKRNFTIGIDTETQGLNFADVNSIVLCYSVSNKRGHGYTVWLNAEVPVEQADFTIRWPRSVSGKKGKGLATVGIKQFPQYKRRIRELRQLLKRKDIKKVMMNGVYDLLRFYQLLGNYQLNSWTMDIQAVSHVLDENSFTQASLEMLMQSFTTMPTNQKQTYLRGINKSDMLAAPPRQVTMYAGSDADGTRQVARSVKRRLLEEPRTANYYIKLVQPVLQHVIYPMSRNGIYIDTEAIPEAEEAIDREMTEAHASCLEIIDNHAPGVTEAHRDAGLTLTRRDLVRDFLFDGTIGMGLRPMSYTTTQSASTNKGDLTLIRDLDGTPPEVVDFINRYQTYSEYHTLKTRYINGLKKAVIDSRIYPSWSIVATVTGRLAGSNPNPMNFPKRSVSAQYIRRLIAAPPGWRLMAFDYNQSELRWIAHESGDETMNRIFLQGGDIHVVTAEEVLGVSLDAVTKEEAKDYRRNAKSINFGFIYGMGSRKYQMFAHTDYGVIISLQEAEQRRNDYFLLYNGLPPWHDRMISQAHRNKYVYSPLGRKRHLPMIDSEDQMMASLAERQAINSPIQGASSDSGLLAMARAEMNRDLDPKKAIQSMFVHDELVYCVREDYMHEAKAAVIHNMENLPFEDFGFTMSVPLIADCEEGQNLSVMNKF